MPAERVTRFRFRGTEPALSARGTLEGEKRLPAGSEGLLEEVVGKPGLC